MAQPFVIWIGKQPLKKKSPLYRVVDRGPARPNRPDDVPYSLEKQVGVSMMKKRQWGQPQNAEQKQDAIYALVHAFGMLLSVDPKRLDLAHPLHCEINMAIVENRPSLGCDCNGPADPLDDPEPNVSQLDAATAADDDMVQLGELATAAGLVDDGAKTLPMASETCILVHLIMKTVDVENSSWFKIPVFEHIKHCPKCSEWVEALNDPKAYSAIPASQEDAARAALPAMFGGLKP